MSFTNSSVLIYNNATNTVVDFQTNQATPLSVSLPGSQNGVALEYVISRAGFNALRGSFTGGGAIDISATPSERKTASGSNLFTGSSSPNVTINFDLTSGSETCFIDIGNGSVTAQQIVDELETALETQDGCQFLIERAGSQCTLEVLAGQTYLLLGTQYRVRRENTGDVNAAIEAFVISADGTPLDGANGGVQFLTTTETNVGQEVWDYLLADANLAGSFGELIRTNIDAQISSISGGGSSLTAQEVWEYDVSAIATEGQAGKELLDAQAVADLTPVITAISNLNDFDPATDQVIVGTNNDKTDYELANGAITSNKVANNAFNNSAFTTGYFNSINSEVDTALADYDGPTKAELDAAQASIEADIAAIPATDISSLETKVQADARQLEITNNQTTINDGVKKASLLIPHGDDLS